MRAQVVNVAAPAHVPHNLFHVGVGGAGKTHGLQLQANYLLRRTKRQLLVFNNARDWPGVCRPPVIARCSEHTGARRALQAGYRYVEVTPQRDAVALGKELAQVAYDAGATLVIAEAHELLPNVRFEYLDERWRLLISQWRHRGAGLWMDSQRFAAVSLSARLACHLWRIYALAGDDLDALRKMAGREHGPKLYAAVERCAELLGVPNTPTSQPGYHVDVQPGLRRGPFPLKREVP